eukprot:Sspe_Gene.26148::Locus_10712_Transcript_1_1_Confidence_1.000_Length_401::g.26148::m.26148
MSLVWRKVTCDGEVPAPRSGHSAVVHKHYLYVYGGLGKWRYGDFYRCDLRNDPVVWEKVDVKGDMPPERCKASLAVHGDVIFLFGGWGKGHRNSEQSKMDDLWAMHVGEWKWKKIESTRSPPPRSNHSCAVVG